MTPQCPACGAPIPWWETGDEWGSWEMECPQCKIALEAPFQKVAVGVTVAMLALTMFIGFYLEALGVVGSTGKWWVWGLGTLASFYGWVVSWRFTRFRIKGGADD